MTASIIISSMARDEGDRNVGSRLTDCYLSREMFSSPYNIVSSRSLLKPDYQKPGIGRSTGRYPTKVNQGEQGYGVHSYALP